MFGSNAVDTKEAFYLWYLSLSDDVFLFIEHEIIVITIIKN